MAVGQLQPTSPRPALTFDVPAPLRHVRAARFPTDKVEQLVELLATGAQSRSVSLALPDDDLSEPVFLRRSDGSSVYTVAGSELSTANRILAPKQPVRETVGVGPILNQH
jgi:hypothetical protein